MIEQEQTDGVTVVKLCHGKANAMDVELCCALAETFTALNAESDRGGIVLVGSDRIFSAGLDLKRLLAGGADYIDALYPVVEECFRSIWCSDRPVVAAINGHAIAGGCILAAATDVRLMAKGNGRIGVPELLVGVPFPPLVFEILRAAVAPQHLRTIAFLGATYPAEEALEVGLVDRLVSTEDVLPEAMETARQLGAIRPAAFAHNKQQLRQPALDWLSANEARNEACREMWRSPATQEAVAAYVERTL